MDEIIIGVYLLGDFNARTRTVNDLVINKVHDNGNPEFDILTEDYIDMNTVLKSLGMNITRTNRDVAPFNKAEKELIEFCNVHNLLIANGRVGYHQFLGVYLHKK